MHRPQPVNLLRRRALAWLGVATLPGLGHAQGRFPDKPIQLIVPCGPGGIADITARTVAEAMGRAWAGRWWWTTAPARAASWPARRRPRPSPMATRCC